MFTQILVRTSVPPLTVLHDLRERLVQIDREQQVMRVRDLEQWITSLTEYAQQRVVAGLFAIFSGLALVLATAGLCSVISYSVATRTNEFGIRMALGARAVDVIRIALKGMSVNVGAGLVPGLALSLIFDKLASQWVNASSRDPLILGGISVLLAWWPHSLPLPRPAAPHRSTPWKRCGTSSAPRGKSS
jgi:ABC-type antimicrobial peptide transport system permease subunit